MQPEKFSTRETSTDAKRFTLLGADRVPYLSASPGRLGGNGLGRLYGKLDCPSALRAIECGGYVEHRVFFADESTAVAAGFRPCGTCLREKYQEWKAQQR
ncbi:metal-binding protein [Flexivirga alba]|uniref:Metal-binding protein n=1 Tax=Flexivirga alba TaxID=702742 RepID=A0ABW2AEJ6_9MICO